jgi:hypothetical protein
MKYLLIKLLHKLLWHLSDDAVGTIRFLGEIYADAPKKYRTVSFYVNEYYTLLDCRQFDKKEVLDWLNKEHKVEK